MDLLVRTDRFPESRYPQYTAYQNHLIRSPRKYKHGKRKLSKWGKREITDRSNWLGSTNKRGLKIRTWEFRVQVVRWRGDLPPSIEMEESGRRSQGKRGYLPTSIDTNPDADGRESAEEGTREKVWIERIIIDCANRPGPFNTTRYAVECPVRVDNVDRSGLFSGIH